MTTLKAVKGRGLLCNRVGSPNAQKQTHRSGNCAPVSRGIWAFPWPLNDYFFSAHQIDRLLPKEYATIKDEKPSPEFWELYYAKRREILKRDLKTKQLWWDRPFYSKIAPDDKLTSARWYLWDDAKAFVQKAESSRFHVEYDKYNKKYCIGKYSIDHLEIFLPSTGAPDRLPKIIID